MIAGPLRPEAQRAAADFRAFHRRLVALKTRIQTTMGSPPDAAPIRQELAAAILALGYVQVRAPDALRIDPGYVLAAFADEMLLVECADWAEQQGWDQRPLEAMLYGTALAGDRVFAAAEALIDGRRDEICTATTILLAMMMGMRGRWLDRDDRGALARQRDALYALVAGRSYDARDPAPYQRMALRPTALTGASTRPLPPLWPWLATLAAVTLLYLPVSHLVWRANVAETDRLAQAINRRAVESAENSRPVSPGTVAARPDASPLPRPIAPTQPALPVRGPADVEPVGDTGRDAGAAQ
ncbi:DotU family type IV/VI secretion system protein [Sphingomonas sp. 37zxx]|uniref:DotU family type IV/VI secretion system protein n=1 Tax=Sphingomonas sp. 37zxx TaxID=1550073 RepID=UPI00053BE7E5|nr:DotU family type IV/VI secretion system protein [Sphingomonas sp. 37zxx]